MLGRYYPYEENITIVKQYGDNLKVINLATCRIAGFEAEVPEHREKNTANGGKLSNNVVRARTAVQEIALSNDWDYFVTLTLSPEKYDRADLKKWQHDLHEFLHSYNRRKSEDEKVRYLLVPELHSDGISWHMHGLIKGIRKSDLVKNKNGYLDWSAYSDRFGYMSLGEIKDKNRVASYILKYIRKDFDKSITDLGAHLYYCSKGLKRAEVLFRGRAELVGCDWDYVHPDGYCRVKMLSEDNYVDYIRLI